MSEGHKWVAILDDPLEEIDETGLRLRIPKAVQPNDVIHIRLNSSSLDPHGNVRKELRIYHLPPDPTKIPPRFHLGTECRGYAVFRLDDFGLVLYEYDKPIPFFRLRNLLEAENVDVVEVFSEFDKQIYRLKKENRLHEDAEGLYDKASKCKARLFSTDYDAEAETCYLKAVQFLGKIINLEIDRDGKPCPIFW